MSTNIPLTGTFKVTCEYKRKGNWIAGWHTGIDLVGADIIYGTCDGTVTKIGIDKSYGNYIIVQAPDGKFHWFCHLSKATCSVGQKISRTTKIGVMGSTGNSSGKHLHFEIRNISNKYADTVNPADYMSIPNVVGSYNTSNYGIPTTIYNSSPGELKTLARNTNLRNKPTIKSDSTLYLANTTLYVLKSNVANTDGYVWDKVRIRTDNKEGYMINQNYK